MFLFDGQCGFCTRWAEWLARRLPEGHDVRPYQSIERLDEFGLTEADVRAASYWVEPSGELHGGPRAFAAALRRGRGLWPVLGVVLGLPVVRSIAAAVYGWVARNRHRLPAPPRTDE